MVSLPKNFFFRGVFKHQLYVVGGEGSEFLLKFGVTLTILTDINQYWLFSVLVSIS